MEVNGTVKGMRPILHAGVVMRMGDRDRRKAAKRTHQRFGRVIQQRDAVPQNVAQGRSQQQRALADAKSRLGMDFEQILFQASPGVGVSVCQSCRCRPGLSGARHKLAFVLADRQSDGGRGASGREVPQVLQTWIGIERSRAVALP